jgi:hypothetical protein
MKDQVFRGVFMVLFFGAFAAVGHLREWFTQMGVSDATQISVAAIIGFGIPMLVCGVIATGLWKLDN